MRMPIVSLVRLSRSALIFISNRLEPLGSPVATSQIVGVATVRMPTRAGLPTQTNFAAAYKPAAARAAAQTKPARRAELSLQQQQPAADT